MHTDHTYIHIVGLDAASTASRRGAKQQTVLHYHKCPIRSCMYARGRASARVDSRLCPRTSLGADVSGHNQLPIAKGKAGYSKGSNPNLETQSRRERRSQG